MIFKNRSDAGLQLAKKLSGLNLTDAVVVGLTRGGVEVATEIERALDCPLEALVIKKIVSPTDNELGIGAVAPDSVFYVDWKLAGLTGADESFVKPQINRLGVEIKKLQQYYLKVRTKPQLFHKSVILVDDGVATGGSIRASIKWLNAKSVKKIIVALPVAPTDFIESIKSSVTEVIVLQTAENFRSVGDFYKDFAQVTEERVLQLLKNHK
jgi:putative phosphoribosyl transferase